MKLNPRSLIQEARFNLYRFKYRYSPYLNLKKPVDVTLELSSHCNMNCSYCYHADQENLMFKKGFMPLETAVKILTQASELGVPALKFNWKGESTNNPVFSKVTKIAKQLASGSTFIDRLTNSNFKFMTSKDDVFDGLCNQTKVKVSYDSFRKDVFETQRSGGDHALTTANIDKFYNYPNRKNTELVIQAVRTQLNKDEDIEGQAKKRWPSAIISIRDVVAGRLNKDISHLENKTRNLDNRTTCIQAHARLIFNWTGKAYPCCPDIAETLLLGDIHKTNLKRIFNGHMANELRKSLKNKSAFNKFSSCTNCTSFESYKGFKPVWKS